MATYINGVTDYIPQIQSFQPDLNFYGNVMQTRQGKYDAAKKKVSDLYGSILYAPMSREGNIQRRDEFFKVIDNDIKRISGMDLSLEQNQDAAMGVFKGFYDDKYMVNDMVKTKNYQSQMQRGENFKYCTDKEKCGGQYWDAGIQKLQYKMDEFKKVSDDESMNYSIGEFDPYFDWKKEATTKAKELGYDVKMDTPSGKWIVRDTNGKLVEGGLYNLFTSLYGDDPRVKGNYKTEAYVARKNYGATYKDTYGSEEEAEKSYVMKVINQGMDDTKKDLSHISDKYDQMSVTGMKLQKKLDNKTITAREKEDLKLIQEQMPTLQLSRDTLQTRLDEIQTNIDANDFNGLKERADLSASTTYQKRDLEGLAKSLSQIKQSRTLEVNPYTKMYEEFGLQKSLAKYKAGLESQLLAQKGAQDEKLEKLKLGITDQPENVEGYTMDGLPGTNAVEDLKNNKGRLYRENADAALSKFKAASDGSSATLYNLFNAAKNAVNQNSGNNRTARDFLKQFGDDKTITNTTSIQVFQKLIADKKLGSIALFDKFVNDSKAPGFDKSWAKSITDDPAKYSAVINEVSMANQAFNKLTEKNWKVNENIVDKISATAGADNIAGFYAKDLLAKNGKYLDTKENFIARAIRTAAANNATISTREAGKYYDALVEQWHDKYNSAENISLMQGEGLSGGGMRSSVAMGYDLDLAKKGEVVNDVIKLTRNARADFANTKAVIGDMSKESFEKSNVPGLQEFLTWYLNEYKNPKTAARRTLSTIIGNVAGDNAQTSGVTFKGFDPDSVKEYEGSKDRKGPLFDTKILENGATLFFSNKVENPFNKPMSDAEIVLRTTGVASDKGFDGSAGIVNYSLDGDQVSAVWDADVYDVKTGTWISESYPIKSFHISKIKENRDAINAELASSAKINAAREAQYIEYNKSK